MLLSKGDSKNGYLWFGPKIPFGYFQEALQSIHDNVNYYSVSLVEKGKKENCKGILK